MDIKELKTNHTMQAILALFLISVLMVVGIVLNVKKISSSDDKLLQVQQSLDISNTQLNRLIELASNEEKTQAEFAALQAYLPVGINQTEIFDTVEALSKQYNINQIEKISFGEPIALGQINSIPVQMSFIGSYRSVMAMLEEYTLGKRLVILNKVTVRPQADSSGMIKAEVDLSVCYQ
ncbi:MAG: type 4a pilus biogenesis protein PilO [Oscillospiraceae bacterium]